MAAKTVPCPACDGKGRLPDLSPPGGPQGNWVVEPPQHPEGNYWFAADWPDDEDKGWPDDEVFRWRVWIQMPWGVDHLSTRHESAEAAEEFIRHDILGAPLEA